MLAVNVSLLAIPGVVPSGSNASNLTSGEAFIIPVTQTTSLLSTLASVISILVGLQLIRSVGTNLRPEDLASTVSESSLLTFLVLW